MWKACYFSTITDANRNAVVVAHVTTDTIQCKMNTHLIYYIYSVYAFDYVEFSTVGGKFGRD